MSIRRNAAVTVVALALSGAVMAPTATAAPAERAGSVGALACATKTLTTGYQKVGTTVNKSGSSSCNDLNLTWSNDAQSSYGDSYRGFYKASSGWKAGSRGYVWAGDGSHSPWKVLLSDVAAGTPMGVGSYYDGGDSVTVAH